MRLLSDFQKIRKESDRYTMPNISMILVDLVKTKHFTTLNLKSGYHNISIDDCERDTSMSSDDFHFSYVYVNDVISFSIDEDAHIGKTKYFTTLDLKSG